MRVLFAALAAIALTACDPNATPLGGGGSADAPPAADVKQAQLSGAEREQLVTLTRSYLDTAVGANAPGYTPVAGIEDEINDLQPGQDHRWQVNLPGGASYRIIGVCDNECTDLDMELLDASGGVVASDVLLDDLPIVNVTPASDTRYTVRLILKTCTVAPCYVGARVMRAP